jgi:hypothetical protein
MRPGVLSLQELLERVGEREGAAFVVLLEHRDVRDLDQLPAWGARLKIRFSVVNSRLISPFETFRSVRSSPSPVAITSA